MGQSWDRIALKTRAKGVLRNSYWMSFFTYIISMFVSGVAVSVVVYPVTLIYALVLGTSYAQYPEGSTAAESVTVVGTILLTVLMMAIALAIVLFVSNVIEVGLARFFLAARAGHISIDELFFGFKNGNYMPIVKIMFRRTLYIFLWVLIPLAGPIIAIVKSYSYFMVPYIAAENPTITPERAMQISEQTTMGEKGDMFVLDLSFIGWYLLGSFACGLGEFFVPPYHNATWAELYGALRFKATAANISGPAEIGADVQ